MVKHAPHHRHKLPDEHQCPVILFGFITLGVGLLCFILGFGSGQGIYPPALFNTLTGIGLAAGAGLIIIWIGMRK